MGPPKPSPSRFIALGVDRPRIAFSEVLTFDLNGEAIHLVRQAPGYSDADTLAHFHVANLVYLGEVFSGDGYPDIGTSQGGKLDGFVKTLSPWTDSALRVVPARGAIASGADVKAFRDMIVAVRSRVKSMIAAGQSESQILAQHPTAEFDARWGHGRVSGANFVKAVYAELGGR